MFGCPPAPQAALRCRYALPEWGVDAVIIQFCQALERQGAGLIDRSVLAFGPGAIEGIGAELGACPPEEPVDVAADRDTEYESALGQRCLCTHDVHRGG